MKLSEAQINVEVERYRQHLKEVNREPTATELAAEARESEQRLNRTAGWLGLESDAARKIFSEGPGHFDPSFNARRLREVAR